MRTRSISHRRHASGKRGLAIVIVVSLMAMLMVLILAFLLTSSTHRNASSTEVAMRQADNLADLAEETLVADLREEMIAGSIKVTTTPDNETSYEVEDPKAMIPSRAVKSSIATDTRLNLLVKQSAGGVKFHSLGASALTRASSISTTTPAADGRRVAGTRWSAPRFFENGGELGNSQVPDWIYVTRGGTNPTTFSGPNSKYLNPDGSTSNDFIVGRYAYQVYDVSGLLDANVAGHGAAAPALGVARKGSLVWADLTVLSADSSGLPKLAEWRHSGGWSNPLDDLIRPWGEPEGWLRAPIFNGKSDNLFLNRHDLIAYQKRNPTVVSEALLAYLSTDSRELSQPSWSPTFDAGGVFDYKAKKNDTNSVNRRFAGVRVLSSFTRRDGSKAVIGEPLIHNRFPLSKLKAFTEGNRTDILNYFGLVPAIETSGKVLAWKHANALDGSVRKLQEVATENREPDFFELLKAGLQEGSVANSMASNGFFQDIGRDNKDSYQIYRIGASVIDQWDTDDDPTVIQFGQANPLTGVRVDDAIGVENLPYLHFIGESRFRRRDQAAPPNDSIATTFLTFQLWNPHKNAAQGKLATGSYRLAFSGKSFMEWNTSTAAGYTDPGYTPYRRTSPVRTSTFEADYIQFSVASGANSFAQPLYLKPGTAGAISSKPNDTINGPAPVIGYNVGEVDAPYTSAGTHGQRYNTNGMFSRYDPSLNIALQKNINGTWVTYQLIPDWTLTHGFVIGSLVDNTNRLFAANGDYVNLHAMLIDPRTSRYGLSTTTGGDQAINNTTGNRTYDNKFFPPSNWTNPGGRRPQEYQANASSGSTSRIVHRDNKRRPADAGTPFTAESNRPEILNRPFQCVADMGFAFRDEPWTSLNFFGDPDDATTPGDGALLDLFSMTESPVRGGVVNPNSAPAAVLETLLSKAAIREGVTLTAAQAKTYAQAIRAELTANPLLNPADIAPLAGKITRTIPITSSLNHKDRHFIARALADVANVHTWNLLVDVIAQSGKLAPTAGGLENFVSQGERRVWYHLAIDRFTGQVVDLRRETAFE